MDKIQTSAPKPLQEYIANFRRRKSTSNVIIQTWKPSASLQLPLWPEHRPIPNDIARSALFNARNKKYPRRYLKSAEIYVIGKAKINYTGEELRQDDETVWMQLIHLANLIPLNRSVEFTPYSFCKSIGWNTSGRDYLRLREILTRLQATALEIYNGYIEEGGSFSLIKEFRWKDHASNTTLNKYQVDLSPLLIKLFATKQFTFLEWQQRLSLPLGIATWLQGYFASHQDNYAIRIETIRQGCGIEIKSSKKLKESILAALKQLENCGFLTSSTIINGLVHVSRSTKKNDE